MSQPAFRAFDADHHYYEAEDAFTRHVEPRMQPRAMQWALVNGKQRLLVGGRVNRFIPNPTFDPVARPGCLDEYFRDTPRRVAEGNNGYKADMLRGIWAQAPYLHNGSVPTLGQLICPSTRPARFLRGNLHFDETLVGFEWAERPRVRYSPHDSILIKEIDTAVPGRSNAGHTFGSNLCPDTSGLDPIADRKEIAARITASPVGALLAYLKTL